MARLAGAPALKAPRGGQLQRTVAHIHRLQPSVVPLGQRNGLLQGAVVVQAQVVSEPVNNARVGF